MHNKSSISSKFAHGNGKNWSHKDGQNKYLVCALGIESGYQVFIFQAELELELEAGANLRGFILHKP